MKHRLGRSGLMAAAVLWVLAAAPVVFSHPAVADQPTMKTGAGDVSLPRSEQEMAVAFEAHGILLKALLKRDAEGLLAAGRLMAQLSDPLGVSDMETSFAAAMTMRPALANASNASSNRVVVLEAEDVLLMALQIAQSTGNKALADDIRAQQKALGDRPKKTKTRREACVYGNCCGYNGCWNGCQWW
ncbi:MAG: hypothetical protein ACR2PM_03280 [Hyphomicrobiales bacterium]